MFFCLFDCLFVCLFCFVSVTDVYVSVPVCVFVPVPALCTSLNE